jgi:hypothetical protein
MSDECETSGAPWTVDAAASVGLYQKQVELVERVWSYFSQYSAMMLIVSLFMIFVPESAANSIFNRLMFVFLLVIYLAIAIGNYLTLTLMVDELVMIRGIAIRETALVFKGVRINVQQNFHIFMTAIFSLIYLLALSNIFFKYSE